MTVPKPPKDITLSGQTVKYNGVQFGGSEAAYPMMPPTYNLRTEFVYDDAERVVTHLRCFLTVHTIIYESDEATLSANVDALREYLSEPGKSLELSGLGMGFASNPDDVIWGPKPRGLTLEPVGADIAWELVWTVEFNYKPGVSSVNQRVFFALNWDTTWQNDFEGQTTRVISGYAEIPEHRNPNQPHSTAVRTADELRNHISVPLPEGFRRQSSTFREDKAKRRLNFSFVDVQFTAEPYPIHCTHADGTFSVQSSSEIIASAGAARLAMTVTTRPGVRKAFAAIPFLQMAFGKADMMQRALKKGKIIPRHISVQHRLWSRTTSFEMSWMVTGCLQELLLAGGIWEPVIGTKWKNWKTTINPTLDNRGNAKLASLAAHDVIIDLTDNLPNATIVTPSLSTPQERDRGLRLACGKIPRELSWLAYDVEVEIYRKDRTSVHTKAATFTIDNAARAVEKTLATFVPLAKFIQSLADEPVVERNGPPEVYALVKFKGLRVDYEVKPPVLKTIDGKKVVEVHEQRASDSRPIGTLGAGCHKLMYGWATLVYLVPGGHVSKIKTAGNPSLCDPIPSFSENR